MVIQSGDGAVPARKHCGRTRQAQLQGRNENPATQEGHRGQACSCFSDIDLTLRHPCGDLKSRSLAVVHPRCCLFGESSLRYALRHFESRAIHCVIHVEN